MQIINSNTEIKSHSLINTGSIIEHDYNIGEYCFICPGSIILGSILKLVKILSLVQKILILT